MLTCLDSGQKTGGGVGSGLSSSHPGAAYHFPPHRFADQWSLPGHRLDSGLVYSADRGRAADMELPQPGSVSDVLFGGEVMTPDLRTLPQSLWNCPLGRPSPQFSLAPQAPLHDHRTPTEGSGSRDCARDGTMLQISSNVSNGYESAQSGDRQSAGTGEKKGDPESTQHGEEKDDTTNQKQSQQAETLKWLGENYELVEGVCLPRCVFYSHYQDFCKKRKFVPAGAAAFGKIIRQRFPKLTTRRLGTRGQSKYHYYGIGIKETSQYYHSVYAGKGLTRFSGTKLKTEGSSRKYSLSSKTGTILPDFPDAHNLLLPADKTADVDTFIRMYKSHCQRLLDTCISANFQEISVLMTHFWLGMPQHLLPVLQVELLYDVIALCDSILYKVMVEVLIPSSIQDFPEGLGEDIRRFAKNLPVELGRALEDADVPDALKSRKMEVANLFTKSLTKQMDYVNLALAIRRLLSEEGTERLLGDLARLELEGVLHFFWLAEAECCHSRDHVLQQVLTDLIGLLGKHVTLEAFTEWLDSVVDKHVIRCGGSEVDVRERAKDFMLQVNTLLSGLCRQLTMSDTRSFSSFHILALFLHDHVFLVMHTLQEQRKEKELQENVQRHMKNAEEIKMHAQLRTPSKPQNSPKRKRKAEETFDSNDEAEAAAGEENLPGECAHSGYEPVAGTAFSRPPPSSGSRESSLPLGEEGRGLVGTGSVPVGPIKPIPGNFNSNHGYHGDRHAPFLSINAHHTLPDTFHHVTASRLSQDQSYPELQSLSAGAYSVNNYVATPTASFWSDNRQRPHFANTSGQYGNYGGVTSQYDPYSLKKSSIFSNAFPDAMATATFDTSHGSPYYRPSDHYHVSGPLGVAYGGNFMEIATPQSVGPQYARQDGGGLYVQEDVFAPSLQPAMPKPQYRTPSSDWGSRTTPTLHAPPPATFSAPHNHAFLQGLTFKPAS